MCVSETAECECVVCVYVSVCYLQQYIVVFWQLLAVCFQQVCRGFQGFEVLLCAQLAVSDGHQVTHDSHQFTIIPVGYGLRQPELRVPDK